VDDDGAVIQTTTGSRSSLAARTVSIAFRAASSSGSCSSRSSIAYPLRHSSGKTATATPWALQSRAAAMTAAAFVSGSAKATGTAHAATRAKPWSYKE